ncbi:MAG: hypothetical protein ACRD90_01465 [Nitrosopumilaceae archaeon]
MKTALKSPKDENLWFDIADNEYATKTLHALGDDIKREILTSFIDTPRTINEVLRMHRISHTSGYRKAKSLIDDGLLVSTNISQIERGKSVNTYIPIFKNIIIRIAENKVIIKVQFNKTERNMSLLLPLIDKLAVANKIHLHKW